MSEQKSPAPGLADQALLADQQRQSLVEELLALYQTLPSLESAEAAAYVSRIQQLEALSQDWTGAPGEIASVFAWAASFWLTQEQPEKADSLLSRALLIWEPLLGNLDQLVDKTVYDLGLINAKIGKYAIAEELFLRSVDIRIKRLRATHPATILSLTSLAGIYLRQQKSVEAEAVYQKALALCQRGVGQQHPLAISIQNNLANLYLAKDAAGEKLVQAEQFLLNVCAFYEKQFGTGDLNHARVHVKLAQAYLQQKKWEQAEAILQGARPAYEQHLGTHQPETRDMLSLLAFACASQQKWGEPTKMLLHDLGLAYASGPLSDLEKAIETFACLAQVYLSQQEWEQAEAHLWQIKVWCEQYFGPKQLNTGRALLALTQVHMARARWEQAEMLCEQALAIYLLELGWTHQETLICQQHQALLAEQRGNFAQAAVLNQRVWEAQAVHPDPALAIIGLNNLAEFQITQERFAEAEDLLLRALALCKSQPEVGLLVLARVIKNLAIVYHKQSRYERYADFSSRLAQIKTLLGELLPQALDAPEVTRKDGDPHDMRNEFAEEFLPAGIVNSGMWLNSVP